MNRSRLPDDIVYGDSLNASQQSLIEDYQSASDLLHGYVPIISEAKIQMQIAIGRRWQVRDGVISDMGFGGARYEKRIFR